MLLTSLCIYQHLALEWRFKIILFNQVAAEIAGFTVKDALGKRYDEILVFNDEKTGEKSDGFIHEVIKTGEPKEMSNHTILVNKNGDTVLYYLFIDNKDLIITDNQDAIKKISNLLIVQNTKPL